MSVLRLLKVFLGLWLVCAPAHAGCDRAAILVRNVSVWSPAGLLRGRDVLIADGRVQSVVPARGSRAAAGPAADARIIEGRGATLLPGLIDSHLHLSFNGWRGKPGDHRWGSAAFTGPQNLSAGVTNGRIHLSDLKTGAMLRQESQDDCAPLPRLQAAGPAFIPGSPTHHEGVVWSVTGVDDAADRVRREKAAGFDWIAFHDLHRFTAAERAAIVDTARAEGLRLLGSGYTQEEVASSLAVRPDTIDYLDTSPLPEYAPALIETARAQPQLTWVARLGVHLRREAYLRDLALTETPLIYRFVPTEEVPALKEFALQELKNDGSDYARRMAATLPTLRRKFQQLRDSGIPLAAGTDAGSPNHAHADAIWWELRAWVTYGATPDEALRAVTVNGARVLGRDDLGVIRPGAVGDFVLYRGDLAKGEFDVRHVTHVAKGGVLYLADGRWVGPSPPGMAPLRP